MRYKNLSTCGPGKLTHLCDQGKTIILNCCNKIMGSHKTDCDHELHHSVSHPQVVVTKPENDNTDHDRERPRMTIDCKTFFLSESQHRHDACAHHEAICHWKQGPECTRPKSVIWTKKSRHRSICTRRCTAYSTDKLAHSA